MRSKSGGTRARRSKLPSPTPATRSLPFISLNSGKVCGEFSADRIVDRISREKNDIGRCSNDAGAGTSRDCKNEIDLCDEEDVLVWMDLDLEIKTCICCLKAGGDDIILCCETNCVLSVHKKCLLARIPEFDVKNFRCPYCVYKYSIWRKVKAKKQVRASKKNMSAFMDFEPSGGDKVMMNEERGRGKDSNMSPCGGESNHGDCGERMVANQVENRFVLVESEKPTNQVENRFVLVECGQENDEDNTKLAELFARSTIVVEHQGDSLAPKSCRGDKISPGKEQLPGVESLVDSICKEQSNEKNVTINQDPEILEDIGQVDDGGHETIEEENVEEENVVDGSHHPSNKGFCNSLKPKRRIEEERRHPGGSGTETFDSDTEPIAMRQKRRKGKAQSQNVDSVEKETGKKKARAHNVDSVKKFSSPKGANLEKINMSQNMKVTAPSRKSRQQEASATMFTNLPFANEKRKRKDWKTEEEEMLTEAVHKFSSTVNKNLPWRKMLEFGRHVFDPTRNPTDLKDKWRNMKAKESSSTSRK